MLRGTLFSACWAAGAGIVCVTYWAAPGMAREPTFAQSIGELSGEVAHAIAVEFVVVPFSPANDPHDAPIILAHGEMTVFRNRVLGLSAAERMAIREAYAAGRTILIPDANVHDIEALHTLIEDGIAYESTTDPSLLAYTLRQEEGIPTARIIADHRPVTVEFRPIAGDGEPAETDEQHDLAWDRAMEIVLDELTQPPSVAAEGSLSPSSDDWSASPVQSTIVTSTLYGTYNTPMQVYALHACDENKDYYLVNTGGDWTPTSARFINASANEGQIGPDYERVDWQDGREFCSAGDAVSLYDRGDADIRACKYIHYPMNYQVDIVPESGAGVIQFQAAPSGNQGVSASYTSGVTFNIQGSVNVSGKGPSAGVRAGVTWSNSVSTTVPPLLIEAGNTGNEGTFTRYRYCTVGGTTGSGSCTSDIQMVGRGICNAFFFGDPQNGQTPNGRLSNVAQTAAFQVDPATYVDDGTFDITVRWATELANSGSRLAPSLFKGYCNWFGCDCKMNTETWTEKKEHVFKIPQPSKTCS